GVGAKRFPEFPWGTLANPLPAADIEAEIHDRLLGARVKARLSIGEILALHHHPLLDRQFPAGLHIIQKFYLGWVGAWLCHEAEFEFCGCAQDFLELARVL